MKNISATKYIKKYILLQILLRYTHTYPHTQRKFSILLSYNIPKQDEISVFSSYYYKDKSVSIELHQCNASQPKCAYIGCV